MGCSFFCLSAGAGLHVFQTSHHGGTPQTLGLIGVSASSLTVENGMQACLRRVARTNAQESSTHEVDGRPPIPSRYSVSPQFSGLVKVQSEWPSPRQEAVDVGAYITLHAVRLQPWTDLASTRRDKGPLRIRGLEEMKLCAIYLISISFSSLVTRPLFGDFCVTFSCVQFLARVGVVHSSLQFFAVFRSPNSFNSLVNGQIFPRAASFCDFRVHRTISESLFTSRCS